MKKHLLPPLPLIDWHDDDYEIARVPAPEPPHTTEFFDNAVQAIKALVPEGGTVCPIGFDTDEKFLRAGYRVVRQNADVTIARGGHKEFALARRLGVKKLVLCPTHDYAAAATSAYLDSDGAFAVVKRGIIPHAAVFDETDPPTNLAAAFGEIACLDLCAFDYSFGKMLRGERVDKSLSEQTAALVRNTTAALRSNEKHTSIAAKVIVAAGKHAAEIVQAEPGLLHASGAAQTAQALRMLYRAEDRTVCSPSESEMLVARYVINFYIKNMYTQATLFPPDFTRRTDCICKYLGGDVVRTCVYATPILTPPKLRLYEYRCREFGDEYVKTLAEMLKRQNAAFEVFKHLYPDDGFALKSSIDPMDIGICTALAPDVFPTDSMLTFFKHEGKLEKYLLL